MRGKVAEMKEMLAAWVVSQREYIGELLSRAAEASELERSVEATDPGQPRIVLHVTGTSYKQPPIGQVVVDGDSVGYFAVVSAVSNRHRAAREVEIAGAGDAEIAGVGATEIADATTILDFPLYTEACPKQVEVRFLNDEWAGESETGDTNLLLKSVEVNGTTYSADEFVIDAGAGELYEGYASLWKNGSVRLHLKGGACDGVAASVTEP
jgi:hypothetical protein